MRVLITKIEVGEQIPTNLRRFYKKNGYKGKIDPEDLCIWLLEDEEILGAGRLCSRNFPDKTYLQLRGVWIKANYRNQGIGHQLLQVITDYLREKQLTCFCFALSELENFYQQHGFIITEPCHPELAHQLRRYQNKGQQLNFMSYISEL